jgi:hypothetical protein
MSLTATQTVQNLSTTTPFPAPTFVSTPTAEDTQTKFSFNQTPAASNIETRKALLDTLSAAVKDSSESMVDLKQTKFAVRANSSLGRELAQTETTWRSLDWLITRNGWIMPTEAKDLQNLHDAIAFAPPPAPADRNYWGLLSREIPLTPNQRAQVIHGVAGWIDKSKGGLLDNLGGFTLDDASVQEALKNPQRLSATFSGSRTVDMHGFKYTNQDVFRSETSGAFTQTSTCLQTTRTPSTSAAAHHPTSTSERCMRALTIAPRHALEHLLSSPKAIALGKKLETELGVLATDTSARELAMSALVLTLDPQAGNTRNTIRGFVLDQPSHFGHSAEIVMEALDKHLINTAGVKDTYARAMSYLMLSRVAPQFLVKNLPDTLIYGSHTWMVFSATVARIEQIAPGSSATMTYHQVMDYAGTEPITEQERENALVARRDALMDWAVTNGRIDKKTDANYSVDELKQAQRDFQSQPSSLVLAGPLLGQQQPTREQVALDDLKRIYGENIDFKRVVLQATGDNDEYSRNHFFSLLDVHMSGKLKVGKWRSISSDFAMEPIERQCHRLYDVKREFEEKFDSYYNALLTGTNSIVRDLLSQLPPQDRHGLQHGEQTFYTLRKAVTSGASHLVTKADTEASKGRQGFIIRSEHLSKVTYYEVFPQQGKIQIRTDLPAQLKVGANIQAYVNTESNAQQPFDWAAYSTGDAPRPGVSSELVIEQIRPPFKWQRPSSDKTSDLSFLGGKSYALAEFAASKHLIPDKEALRQNASGESGLEMTHRYQRAGAAAILSLIPFANTLKHAINGDALEAINSFIIDGTMILMPGAPGFRAVAHELKSAKTLFSMFKNASRSTDDLIRLVGAEKVAKPFYSTIPSFGSARPVARNLAQGIGVNAAIKTGADGTAFGTTKLAGETGEATGLLAKFDGKDGWYAVDPISGQPYGSKLNGFLPQESPRSMGGFFDRTPSTPPDPDMPARFQVNVIKAKYGKPTEYMNGYKTTIAPTSVPGYSATMDIKKIETLIANSTLESEQIGSLMRRRDQLILDRVQHDAQAFESQIKTVGGTTQGVPQTYYLSKTGFDLTGECAALSNAMGLALLEGNETTLINNMAVAMANPEAENAAKFISNLSNLQTSVGQETTFHSAAAGSPVPYKTIIERLGQSESSQTLLISSTNHGMLAGVKIDPANITQKSWFFYDPNYGLATFPTQESMAKGLEKSLSSGTGQGLDAFGNFLTGKKYKISTFDAKAIGDKFNIERIRALSTPI